MVDDGGVAPGALFGAYRIEKLLGEGAMGEVYLAIHEALGRHVAIKTLKPAVAADRAMTERFFAEARAVNIIRHENIVECTDLVNDPAGKSYIVMELLEGKTLGVAIREARKMPPRRAARIAAQIADALGAAHDKGIVHRDVKPDNVFLIKRAGSPDYVKVLDFGMARLRPDLGGGAVATQSGALIGTPAYMSPEQARGEKANAAADIYALGAVLFHMLTGQMPFVAQSLSLMLVAVLQETPPRVDKLDAAIPPALAELVERTLAKDPAKRPADMAAFRREVLDAAGLPTEVNASIADPRARGIDASVALDETLDPSVRPAPWAGQSSLSAAAGQVSPPRAASKKWWWLGGGAALAGVAAAGLLMFGGHDSAAPASPATAQPAVSPPSSAPPPVAVPPAAAPSAAVPPAAAPITPPPDPIAAPHAEPANDSAKKPAKRPVAPVVARQPAKAATGSGSAAVVALPPPAPEPVDRTKQLVGPKPASPP